MPAAIDGFTPEKDPEIQELLGLLRTDSSAQTRLMQRIREDSDPRTREDLALLLQRLGATGVDLALTPYFGADAEPCVPASM